MTILCNSISSEFPIDVSYIFLKLLCVILIHIIAVLRAQDHICLSNKRANVFFGCFFFLILFLVIPELVFCESVKLLMIFFLTKHFQYNAISIAFSVIIPNYSSSL